MQVLHFRSTPCRSRAGAALWLLLLAALGATSARAATFTVDRTDDTTDSACTAAANDCSLRGAILAANSLAGADIVELTSGATYTLSLGPADSTPGAYTPYSGDLDITGPLTINGHGATVDAAGIDRVFDIGNGDKFIQVAMFDLTVKGGHPTGVLSCGGGINVRGAGLTMTRCTVTGNTTAEGTLYDNGGGIAVNTLLFPPLAAGLSMTDCTVSGNDGRNGGGIAVGGSATATLTRCTVGNNTAHGGVGGGGLFVAGLAASATITNSTVAVNTAGNLGGGLNLFNGSATVSHATIARNSAKRGGGALPRGGTNDGPHLGSLTSGQTLWQNTATMFPDISGVLASTGYNLFHSSSGVVGSAATDLLDVDAVLDGNGLQPNGGLTQTIALGGGSPALDAGDPAFVSPPGSDQRGTGFPRVEGSHIDIGAYEALQVTVLDASVTEGTGASSTLNFQVKLSSSWTQTVSVDFTTANGTAIAGSDYTATSGTLNFAPGQVSQKVPVTVIGDALNESNETLLLKLSNPVNAVIARTPATGTIMDDDPLPSLTIADATVAEGNSGTKIMVFKATLSAPSGRTVTVNYATADGTATLADNDYVAAIGTLTFSPGVTSKVVPVTIIGDTKVEADETFTVNLSSPVNVTLSSSNATGTILNDDSG